MELLELLAYSLTVFGFLAGGWLGWLVGGNFGAVIGCVAGLFLGLWLDVGAIPAKSKLPHWFAGLGLLAVGTYLYLR